MEKNSAFGISVHILPTVLSTFEGPIPLSPNPGYIGTALGATERRATPDAARDQLEGAGADLLAGADDELTGWIMENNWS